MSIEINSSKSQSIDLFDTNSSTPVQPSEPYQNSACGNILNCLPTDSPVEIFSYLRHGKLDAFRRSLDLYHKQIAHMKNDIEQTVLHVLAIYAYPYQWIRLLLMFSSDPCCQDSDGYTAAHYVVERDDVEMLKALTTGFHSQIKIFSEEQKLAVNKRCLEALSLKQKQGLTVFMLACHCESMKCLDYLHEININDVNLQDNFGDTSLHYAVSRRNENLVNKLLTKFNADVNAGDNIRPSVLDILRFNLEQRKPFETQKDESIEKMLLAHNASSRCQIKRIAKKRKTSDTDYIESNISHLNIRTPSTIRNSQIETARDYARCAFSFETEHKYDDAKQNYNLAMNSISNDILDWADYAFKLSLIHIIQGNNQLALDLLQQALILRKKFENNTEDIEKLQHNIDNITKKL